MGRKKTKKHYTIFLPSILAIAFLVLLGFMFFHGASVPKHNVYVSSENPKQGDTVLIKISGMYPSAIGFFNILFVAKLRMLNDIRTYLLSN